MLVDALARSRHVRGPSAIAAHVKERTGEGPGHSAWSQILYGDITPTIKTIQLFAQAFDLDEEEVTRLSRRYVFRGLDPTLSSAA
jgi:transcriptional regulator with XRE-family HTH domain